MNTIDLGGHVAIVTGAGRGLGRQYALDLARRGARIVVNDVGAELSGKGESTEPAQRVVDEIAALGGEAVADYSDVSDKGAGDALVAAALSRWGRLDAIVNNAGILGGGRSFAELEPDEIQRVLDVNLGGAVRLARAVWPHMVERGYGRIVNVTSHSVFGAPRTAPYVVTRTGHLGLTTALASEGAPLGIKVNCVMPAALTRMTENIPSPDFVGILRRDFGPETVSPLVVLLASPLAPCTGQFFHSGGGLVARLAISVSPGAVGLTSAEDVLARFDEIVDLTGAVSPGSVDDVMAHVFGRVLGSGANASLDL